ncbi:MAG: TauD/TfdA family dioxygenase [Actinomycetota bacterium]
MSADAVRPLEEHAEWRAADVADPDAWTLRLTDDDHVELDAALTIARHRREDVLDVTVDDFPLPGLASRLTALVDDLVNGRGFARIASLDVERLGPDDASWIYWGIGTHLGEPWPQNAKGHLLGNVRDQGKALDDPTARGNEIGGSALGFHSDGSDLVGLMCLEPGVSGGESMVANALLAHNELVRAEPTLAAQLYAPLPYDFRGEQRPGGRPFYSVPAFVEHGGRLFVRYIPGYIHASQRHANAPRLTDAQHEAMAAFDELVADPGHRVEMRLERGEIQFVNNYHVLHARRRYVDDADKGRVRWLKRLWLATHLLGSEDRPARYQRTGAMSHWGDRRTKA